MSERAKPGPKPRPEAERRAVQFRFNVRPDEKAEIEAKAAQLGISQSELIRRAVLCYNKK